MTKGIWFFFIVAFVVLLGGRTKGADLSTTITVLNNTLWVSAVSPLISTVNNPKNAHQGILLTVRDLTWGALGALTLGLTNGSKIAQQFLEIAISSQDTNPSSQTYGRSTPTSKFCKNTYPVSNLIFYQSGNIPWQMQYGNLTNAPPVTVNDPNSIEFASQGIAVIVARFSSQLDPTFLDGSLRPAITLMFAALERHIVSASYTNIFLMKTTSLILLGEFMGNDTIINDGYNRLDSWLNLTMNSGVAEYSSPTYTWVQMDSLNMGHLYAKTALGRAKFKVSLDYIWMDILSTYFVPANQISGSHSRAYNFLICNDSCDIDTYLKMSTYLRPLFEWTDNMPLTTLLRYISGEDVHALLTAIDGGYVVERDHPLFNNGLIPSWLSANRVIVARYGLDTSGQDRYVYVTPHFVMGSSSADYGAQDKTTNIMFEYVGEPLPEINIYADNTDDPYGFSEVLDSTGHPKPVHLQGNVHMSE